MTKHCGASRALAFSKIRIALNPGGGSMVFCVLNTAVYGIRPWQALIGLLALFALTPACASDHADPVWLPRDKAEANLTGLFFFPDGDRYVAILDVRPTLTAPPPYNLAPYEYSIAIDTHTKVEFLKDHYESGSEKQLHEGNLARYGGTIPDPQTISPDVSFTVTLNDADVSVKSFRITGGALKETPVDFFTDPSLPDLARFQDRYANHIWVYTGVRDDPFIFPKFFNANIITMVISIPRAAFQTTSTDWLLWGTSRYAANGEKIDHVGRSNRTQLARFDLLNTLEPKDHVTALREAAGPRAKVQDFFKQVIPPLANLNQLSGYLLRGYDYAPDVMIYSAARAAGFPNGRKLEDDVALTTCQNGDCPLLENSYIDSTRYPRATVNDKPFLNQFPYLAEHWPWRPQPFTGSLWTWFAMNLLWPLIGIVLVLLILAALRSRICRKLLLSRTRNQ